MFIRIKKSGKHCYLQIVKSSRSRGTITQETIANLGRVDDYENNTQLIQLAESCRSIHETIDNRGKKTGRRTRK